MITAASVIPRTKKSSTLSDIKELKPVLEINKYKAKSMNTDAVNTPLLISLLFMARLPITSIRPPWGAVIPPMVPGREKPEVRNSDGGVDGRVLLPSNFELGYESLLTRCIDTNLLQRHERL